MHGKIAIHFEMRINAVLDMEYKFSNTLWLYPGEAAWHFITLPAELARDIKAEHGYKARGFGSLKVRAQIGDSAWDTSIFPDKKSGSYVLPVKKTVRVKEKVNAGDNINCAILI